jgi:hypothetical protein
MNKFRKLGFIEYNGHLEVHNSLLNIVLHDNPHIRRDADIAASAPSSTASSSATSSSTPAKQQPTPSATSPPTKAVLALPQPAP